MKQESIANHSPSKQPPASSNSSNFLEHSQDEWNAVFHFMECLQPRSKVAGNVLQSGLDLLVQIPDTNAGVFDLLGVLRVEGALTRIGSSVSAKSRSAPHFRKEGCSRAVVEERKRVPPQHSALTCWKTAVNNASMNASSRGIFGALGAKETK